MRISEIVLRPLCKPPSKIKSARVLVQAMRGNTPTLKGNQPAPKLEDKSFSILYGMDDKTRAEIIRTIKAAPDGTRIRVDNFKGSLYRGYYGFEVRKNSDGEEYLYRRYEPRQPRGGSLLPDLIPLSDSDFWMEHIRRGDYVDVIYPKRSKT